MPGYLCGKPTTTGGFCKNVVASPGGSCGADHKAAKPAASHKLAAANKPATATHDPFGNGPAYPEVPEQFRTIKDRAYNDARAAMAPLRCTKGLAPWQLNGHAIRADAAAAELAASISDLRAADTGGYVGPTDDPEVADGLTGTDAYVEGIRQMKRAIRGIESATEMMGLTADERAARLAKAHGRAHAAVKLFGTAKDTILQGLSEQEHAAVPGARPSRNAAKVAIDQARWELHGFSSAPRATATANVLVAARQHVTNALAAMDADHFDQPVFNYQALVDLGPAKCADRVKDHLADARKALDGTPGLSTSDKLFRLQAAHNHIVWAAAYTDAAFETLAA